MLGIELVLGILDFDSLHQDRPNTHTISFIPRHTPVLRKNWPDVALILHATSGQSGQTVKDEMFHGLVLGMGRS